MSAVAGPRAAFAGISRLLILAGIIPLAMLSLGAGMLYLQRANALAGTPLDAIPAPQFALTDQNGRQVSLEQFRGEPVALTFLYTHCPDACPLIADEMRQAADMLGPNSGKFAMLAVSTDPRHDDRAAALNFSQVHGMTGRWHYLLGSPDQLSPVWKSYYIGVTPGDTEVMHSEAVFLIDKQGRERALLGLPFSAKDLAGNLRKLLNEG